MAKKIIGFLLCYYELLINVCNDNSIYIKYVMGQSKSNPFKQQIMQQYAVHSSLPDYMITYLTHTQTGQEYLLRELPFNDIREFTTTSQKLKKRSKIRHPTLTNLINLQQRTQDQMCSNFYKIYTLWQYPRHCLADQISARVIKRQPFSQNQLWNILSSTSQAMAVLQQSQIKHQALTTKTILLDKARNVKVADPSAFGVISNLESVQSDRHLKQVYLSPQQCQFIENNKPIINKNPYKNDVFTMGMIMLQCAKLQQMDKCYLNDCSKVNQGEISQQLNQLSSKYGTRMRKVVESMLTMDIRRRPDWFQINQVINNQSKQMGQQAFRQSGINHNYSNSLAYNISPRPVKQPSFVMQGAKSFAGIPLGLPMIPSVQGSYLSAGPSHMSSKLQANPSTERGHNQGSIGNAPAHTVRSQPLNQQQRSQLNHTARSQQLHQPARGQVHRPQPVRVSHVVPQINHDLPERRYTGQQFKVQPRQPQLYQGNLMASPPLVQYHPQIKSPQLLSPTQAINSPTLKPASNPANNNKFVLPNVPANTLQFVQQYFKMGSRYQGYKLNGMRHGFGKFYYQDGGRYQGDWRQNKMDGQGKLYYQSNKLAYEGAWLKDTFQGRGKLYNQQPVPSSQSFDYRNFDQIEDNWQYYQGEFIGDLKNGRGVLKFANGQYFEGAFREDMVEGQGVFYSKNGKIVKGVWSQNQLVKYLT